MELDLRAGDLVLVDSAPLIHLAEGAPGDRRRAAAEAFFEAAAAAGWRLAASTLAWTELLAKPLAAGDEALAARHRRLLAESRAIYLHPLDVAVAEEAAALLAATRRGKGRGLETADAVHIATARILGAAAVITNDEAWRAVPGCPRVFLLDELAFGLDD